MRIAGLEAYSGLHYLHGDHLGSASLATWGQLPILLKHQVYLPLVLREYGTGARRSAGPAPWRSPLRGPLAVPPAHPAAEREPPGAVVADSETRYWPYGETRAGAVPIAGITDYAYTGQQLDVATGLYFYQARYYHPALGRFISADTLVPSPGDPQSLNRYSYVRNNPLKYTDPSGHYIDEAPCSKGIHPGMAGSDRDTNVHHWAWALVVGAEYGLGGSTINTGREIVQIW